MHRLQLLLVLCFIRSNLAELIFVQLLYRHGERTPLSVYPHSPYPEDAWPNGLGQLTKLGCQQQYELGAYLRSRYANFLSPNCVMTEVYVRSTDTDRTLMSAQCNNAAFFKPKDAEQEWIRGIDWQPIPIHTKPKMEDYLLRTGFECPRLSEVIESSSDVAKRVNEAYSELFNYLGPLTGFEAFDWNHTPLVADTLKRISVNNFTFPEWSLEEWMDADSGQKMPIKDIIINLNNKRRVNEFDTIEKAKLESGLFVGTVVSNIDGKINGSLRTPTKMFVYSAHDGVILAFMSGLGISNDRIPPVASCLMVELHKEGDDYFVKVYLRNSTDHEPFLLVPPNCNDDGCTLTQYKEASRPSALWSLSQRNAECYDIKH